MWAIADLHLDRPENARAFAAIAPDPQGALILAGDVCESLSELERAVRLACARFAAVVWVPGNHELYAIDPADRHLRGVARYQACVELCRRLGASTPEDPFPVWETPAGAYRVAPLFVLYDFSFRPAHVAAADVAAWAAEDGIRCNDDVYLDCTPHAGPAAWCAERLALSAPRLEAARAEGLPLILVNHHPLRQDLVRIPLVPRLAPWCGTSQTEHWGRTYGAAVVISGHLHVRATDWREGVRYEEVSLGYPRQWRQGQAIEAYLRPILPVTPELEAQAAANATVWRHQD